MAGNGKGTALYIKGRRFAARGCCAVRGHWEPPKAGSALPAPFHVQVLVLLLHHLRQVLGTPLLPLGRDTSQHLQLVPQGAWQRREGRGQFKQRSL